MLHLMATITSEEGLKGRTAAALVKTAGKFSSQILIEQGNKRINAKSVMGVLSLTLRQHDEIHFVFSGDDEKEAYNAVLQLVQNGFAEEKTQ